MALATTALCAGCGGGGASAEGGGKTYSVEASTTLTTANLSKAQFIPRVNQLCREAWNVITSNFVEYSRGQDPTLSEKKRLAEGIQLSVLAGIDFHIFDTIRQTGAPKGEEREVEKIIGSMQSVVEQGQKQEPPNIYSVAQLTEEFREYNHFARQYGLDDCLVDETHLKKIEA